MTFRAFKADAQSFLRLELKIGGPGVKHSESDSCLMMIETHLSAVQLLANHLSSSRVPVGATHGVCLTLHLDMNFTVAPGCTTGFLAVYQNNFDLICGKQR